MIAAGIDAGSRSVKVVIFDTERNAIVASAIGDQGIDPDRLSTELLAEALLRGGLERRHISAVVATGYGRNAVRCADATRNEVTCHGRGVRHWLRDARTVVEIGGQDSKVISLEEDGQVRDFAMSDRCAAGSGRFLEVAAARLGLKLVQLGEIARRSRNPALINSTCVVFAETEMIGLLAQRTPPEDIAAGVQRAIAARVSGLVGRGWVPPIYFTGGVALQVGMADALGSALSCPVAVSPCPQYTGALGAAILAAATRPLDVGDA